MWRGLWCKRLSLAWWRKLCYGLLHCSLQLSGISFQWQWLIQGQNLVFAYLKIRVTVTALLSGTEKFCLPLFFWYLMNLKKFLQQLKRLLFRMTSTNQELFLDHAKIFSIYVCIIFHQSFTPLCRMLKTVCEQNGHLGFMIREALHAYLQGSWWGH